MKWCRVFLVCTFSFWFAALSAGQAPPRAPDWNGWRFMIGHWVGASSGQPGEGVGDFSLLPHLDGRVLIRESRADYPATKDHPEIHHRDLMVIYPGRTGAPSTRHSRDGGNPGEAARAIYFDNEGHVIEYTAELAADHKGATLVSETKPGMPRFRLSYREVASNTLNIKFEIAPPDKPEAFSTYLEGTVHRAAPKGSRQPS